MKIFKCSQVKTIDAYTIAHEPISSIDLMERAATKLFHHIVAKYPYAKCFAVYAGPGNNGGDGVALARMLAQIGYHVKLHILGSANYSSDIQVNIKRLEMQGVVTPNYILNESDFPASDPDTIVIDALFGSGLSRPLDGVAAKLVDHINSLSSAVVAIDIPSGLFGEDNPSPNPNPVVKASFTLTLQFTKLSFIFPENEKFVGKWAVVDIGLHRKIIEEEFTPYIYVDFEIVKQHYTPRGIFSHKGTFGHALIIAGSRGMMGASTLSVNACLRAGAGLVTAHIPQVGYSIMQSQAPEALVQLDEDTNHFSKVHDITKYSAVAVGPGIGQDEITVNAFRNLIGSVNIPIVIDADGLNILSKHKDLLDLLPANTILTPHVGEFNRLFGHASSGCKRLILAIEMAAKYNVIIVVKGAFTQVVCPSGMVYVNSTGNAGLATGGSGDVLTGIIAGLLAQGYSPESACVVGVYIHGLAADLVAQSVSQTSMVATDLLCYIGKAFSHLE